MRIRSMLGLLAFSILPSVLAAQGACPSLTAGATVRVHSLPAARFTVPQTVQPGDTALALAPLAGGTPLSMRCADMQRVQLRTGPARGRSALRGAGIGLLTGAVIGAGLGYFGTEEAEPGEWNILGPEEVAGIGAVFFGGVGAVTGGVIGFVAPGSRWQDVPLAPRPAHASAQGLRVAPAGGSQVRVSYTLPL
jgi:hypothetical protein